MNVPAFHRATAQGARLLAMLTRYAEEGREAPTNHEMAEYLGIEHSTTASKALQRLEVRGDVTVQRFKDFRIVTITATGKSTAEAQPPAGAPHTDGAAADDQPQGDAAGLLPKLKPVSLDREPCRLCGVRGDIGCRHSRATQRLVSVPVFRHFSEVARG